MAGPDSTAGYGTIRYDVADGVATITLDRPAKLNAISGSLRRELSSALRRAADDPPVRVVLLRGEGRAFSSGVDIADDPIENDWLLTDDGMAMHRRFEREYESQLMRDIWDNPKTIVASVHGYCIGFAVDIVNNCDLAIASDDATFYRPEARFGGVLMALLPWTVGIRRAKEILLLGERFSAEEAWRIGMINRVVARERLEEETRELVSRLALIPPETLYFGKLAVNRAFERAGLREAVASSYALNTLASLTEGSARNWARIRRERGHQAALDWRDRHATP